MDQHCPEYADRQDDDSCFRTKRSTRPQLGTRNGNVKQSGTVQAGYGEAKYRALEKIPADMKADGKPELTCSDKPIDE
jgi:hypothetical protein